MKYLPFLSFLLITSFSFSQGRIIDFETGELATSYTGSSKITLTQANGTLSASLNNVGPDYASFQVGIPESYDVTDNPFVSIIIRSTSDATVRIDLKDEDGKTTNRNPMLIGLAGDNVNDTLKFSYNGRFEQGWPSYSTVDPTTINELSIFFNPGFGNGVTGDVVIEEIRIGDVAYIEPPFSTRGIHVNQIGFYPLEKKVAIFSEASLDDFYVVDATSLDSVYTSTLTDEAYWDLSGDRTQLGDFSSLETEGVYYLTSGSLKSNNFEIKNNVHEDVAKASLKAFYFNRCSQEISSDLGGIWARPLGHVDDRIYIHESAASNKRPVNTIISAPKGWYDAGDYNKYIVNASITTYTLMAAYEHYGDYFDQLEVGIPESGDDVPDILDEIKWNLDWMLDMQDPNDGGVYTKLTFSGFSGTVMPDRAYGRRYVVQKSTPATLDFAATMAVAYRIFQQYEDQFPGYADRCLDAAWGAWFWSIDNPEIYYDQDDMNTIYSPAVTTGGYGDWRVEDELNWAASELYIVSHEESLTSYITYADYGVPGWQNVGTLGYISLSHHKDALPSDFNATRAETLVQNVGLGINANIDSNPYQTAMGSESWNYNWGSNGIAANQSFMLLQNYVINGSVTYLDLAISNVDYLLGRNPLGQSYITGYGVKSPMHIHHRPSEADENSEPIPGFVAGGPNPGQQDGCIGYPSSLPALSYLDQECSYATNEIAINWNAPLVYTLNAAEAHFSGFSRTVRAFETAPVGSPMLSVNKYNNDLQLKVYPNPTTDIVNFENEVEEVVLYSMQGVVLLTEISTKSIDVSQFNDGLYLLELREGDAVTTKTIVKQ